jgi:hypothetical protein
LHALTRGYVDGYAEDAGGGEFGGQGVDCGERGAQGAFEVPEAEARGAVFEQGSGAGEAEGAGTAGYWELGVSVVFYSCYVVVIYVAVVAGIMLHADKRLPLGNCKTLERD